MKVTPTWTMKNGSQSEKNFNKEAAAYQIGMRLRQLRERENLSLEKLSMELDDKCELKISPRQMIDWEGGKALPKLENIISVSNYYNVSVKFILLGD